MFKKKLKLIVFLYFNNKQQQNLTEWISDNFSAYLSMTKQFQKNKH